MGARERLLARARAETAIPAPSPGEPVQEPAVQMDGPTPPLRRAAMEPVPMPRVQQRPRTRRIRLAPLGWAAALLFVVAAGLSVGAWSHRSARVAGVRDSGAAAGRADPAAGRDGGTGGRGTSIRRRGRPIRRAGCRSATAIAGGARLPALVCRTWRADQDGRRVSRRSPRRRGGPCHDSSPVGADAGGRRHRGAGPRQLGANRPSSARLATSVA
jgi:hypothetical protein